MPYLHASKNKFSSASNTFSNKDSLKENEEISEFISNPRFVHDHNDELALVEYSSGSDIKQKNNRKLARYNPNPRMHMYRRLGSEEVSQIRLENRNRMARRETQNPLMQFFRMILIKFGCSDH